jgi:hydrogenase expression/formation protein HypD
MNFTKGWPPMNTQAFSDPNAARELVAAIARRAAGLPTVRIMEVCGTHTMAIGRLGLRHLLPENVELVSGPGCPVCVTPASYIDTAAGLARAKKVRIATFGDMFRVPGNSLSFAQVKAEGALVEVVTSPLAALDLARDRPNEEIVFTAVGFETTIPSTASAVRRAEEEKLGNLSFFVAHRLVPPALDVLAADPSLGISAFLLPGHVSAILGEAPYALLVKHGIPGVITGFEPLDILAGILATIDLIARHAPAIKNEYTRVVHPEGNPAARALIDSVYEPCDAVWRGIGALPASGLRLHPEYSRFDAAVRYGLAAETADMPGGCRCGDVLKGKLRPDECPLFGSACTPDRPVGPCMVSSEGSCAACHKYGW